jgi:hypothetical protein
VQVNNGVYNPWNLHPTCCVITTSVRRLLVQLETVKQHKDPSPLIPPQLSVAHAPDFQIRLSRPSAQLSALLFPPLDRFALVFNPQYGTWYLSNTFTSIKSFGNLDCDQIISLAAGHSGQPFVHSTPTNQPTNQPTYRADPFLPPAEASCVPLPHTYLH